MEYILAGSIVWIEKSLYKPVLFSLPFYIGTPVAMPRAKLRAMKLAQWRFQIPEQQSSEGKAVDNETSEVEV